jgi:hypothetical protein
VKEPVSIMKIVICLKATQRATRHARLSSLSYPHNGNVWRIYLENPKLALLLALYSCIRITH